MLQALYQNAFKIAIDYLTALLRCILHTVKFPYLMCISPWFLVDPKRHTFILKIILENFHHTPFKKPP